LNILKDERPTSNIERRTSNNDVASLFKLIQHKHPTLNDYFFSAVVILGTKILINFSVFLFFHSTFDVGRSMFDVHLLIRSMFTFCA